MYGTEVVLPVEVMTPTSIYGMMSGEDNQCELAHDVDTMDELRERAKIRMASYQQQIANTYNRHVYVRIFQVGDLVLRKTFQNTMDMTTWKFNDKWEGPYLIDAVVGRGAYRLSTLDGINIPRSWNATHLNKYHV